MNAHDLIGKIGYENAKQLIGNKPKFIREEISQDETMYCPRTQKYIVRGPQSVMIQLDKSSDDYSHSTMPYSSSFYTECIRLKDIEAALLGYRRQNKIYEIGDMVVPLSDYSKEVCELTEDYIGLDFKYKTRSGGFGYIVKSFMPYAWRHATDEEIKRGTK